MKPAEKRIDLIGLDGAGHWVAAAKAQAGSVVFRTVIDTAGFRFSNINSLARIIHRGIGQGHFLHIECERGV